MVAMTLPTIPGYTLQTRLGQGAFGVVYEAWWKGDFACAVKVLEGGAWHGGYLGSVLEQLLEEPQHGGLLPVYAYDLEGAVPHVSMALLPGGAVTFDDLAGELSGEEAWVLLGQLGEVLAWLHQRGLGHGGLSGGNVMVVAEADGTPRVLLTDVGQAWLGGGSMERLHHQAPYVSPERWREPDRALREGGVESWDVYAFGVLAWRLVHGRWPRGDALFERVQASPGEALAVDPGAFAEWLSREAAPQWPGAARGPGEAARRAVVEACLAVDPAGRPSSMVEVVKALAAAEPTALGVAVPLEPGGVDGGIDGGEAGQLGAEPKVRPKGKGSRWALAAGLLLGAGGWGLGLLERREAALDRAEAASVAGGGGAGEGARAMEGKAAEASRERSRWERLGEEREQWVRLAAAVRESRPAEAAGLAAWKRAAEPVAEGFKAALEAAEAVPGLAAENGEPRWQLATFYEELGRAEEALPLLEKLAQEVAAGGGAALGEEEQGLAARCGRRRGAILLGQQRASEAAAVLGEASRNFAAWCLARPERRDRARAYAENSLEEGRALREGEEVALARGALARVAALLGKPGDPGFATEDYFTLSDALVEEAGMEAAAGSLEVAVERHLQAIRWLVSCAQENPQSVPCRRRLADSYFSLGRLFARNSTPNDASVAFSEVVKLLAELSEEAPGESAYRLQLARTYDEVAQLIQLSRPDPAGAKEALEYQGGSLTILRNLREANGADPVILRQLGAALVLHGELQEAAGDAAGGLAQHEEALALLEKSAGEPGLRASDQRESRQWMARAWAALGGIHEKAGRQEEAVASLSQAVEVWSSLPKGDAAVAAKLAAARERLAKLKPPS